MHDKRYYIRIFLLQPFSWLRICCMLAALLGSQYFVFSSFAAVEGHTHTSPGGRRVQPSLAIPRRTGIKANQIAANLNVAAGASQGNKYHRTVGTTPGVVRRPDLAINVQADADSYLPGATVNYTLAVNNSPGAGAVSIEEPVVVTDLVPLGLSDITLVTSSLQAWKFTITSTTSPSLVVATYTGALPIASGSTLPTIHIAGRVMPQAGLSLINVGSVNVTGDPISSNNMAIVEVTILASGITPSPVVAVTQTPSLLLTATPVPPGTVMPSSTMTVTPTAPSTPSVVPTATLAPTPTVMPAATPTATATAMPAATPTATATAFPTATPTVMPIATATMPITPTMTASLRPALVTTQTTAGGKYFTVGQQMQYVVLVRNLPEAGAELLPITLTDFVRPGLTQVIATGNNWNFSVSATSSPVTIFARYTGAYPIMPGQVLQPIMLTGTLTKDAVPELTNTAVVTSTDDPGISNVDTTSDTVFVLPVQPTSGAGSPVPTATMPVIGTPSPTIPPELAVAAIHLNGDSYRVGDQMNTVLIVHNLAQAGPIEFPNPVSVTYILPVGATNLVAHGQGWTFVLSSTTSPAVISAFYNGHFPIGTGDALPAITLSATLTVEAIPSLTGTAIVDTPGNISTSNLFTDTLFVSKQRVSCPGENCNTGSTGTGQSGTQVPGKSGNSNGSGKGGISNGSGNNGNNTPGQSGSGGSPHGSLPGLPGTGSDPNL